MRKATSITFASFIFNFIFISIVINLLNCRRRSANMPEHIIFNVHVLINIIYVCCF